MLLPDARDNVGTAIRMLGSPEFFYRESHRIIYEAVEDMYDREDDIDPVTLAEELEKRDQLEAAGGANYLAELINSVPTAAHVEHYAEIVKEKYTHRELIETCEEIIRESYQESLSPDELLDRAEQKIFSVRERKGSEGLSRIKEVMRSTFERLEEADRREDVIAGLSTGYTRLDNLTSGFQESQLIIVAARPGMGKTALALNIAQHVALEEEEPVAIFSFEMPNNSLVMRLLSATSQVSFEKLRDGNLTDEDWHKVTNAMARLSQAPVYLDDNPGNVLQMKADARRLRAEEGLSLLIVDYLQLIEGHTNSDTRERELAAISRGLKQLAMELKIPVIALTQLNRKPENRGGSKKPRLSDLRGSGAIEQDADLVGFIYRHYEYSKDEADKGSAELILDKQRNGPTGTVQLSWVDKYMAFRNPETHREAPF